MKEHTANEKNEGPLSREEKADLKNNIYKNLQLPATSGSIWYSTGGLQGWINRTVAAAVVLLCLIPVYYWLKPASLPATGIAQAPREIRSGSTEIKKITLQDSTVVVLNANSVLRYQPSFEKNNIREVELEGNAFFSVTGDAHKPFVVKTKLVSVTVLGTSLNVNARPGVLAITLATGKIRVAKTISPSDVVYMNPGEKLGIDSITHSFIREKTDPKLYDAWTKGQWNFQQTTMREVARLLNEYYGTETTFDRALKADMRITAVLPVTSLRNLLDVIQQTLHVTIEKNNNKLRVL